MRLLGLKKVRVKSIVVPGDFRSRFETVSVRELAQSLDSHDLLSPIGLQYPGAKLIFGGDRLAAHMVGGKAFIQALAYECTNEEAREAQLVENAVRRHDPSEQGRARDELLALYTKAVDRAEPGLSEPAKKERVRARTAEVLGVKPETVKRGEYRAAERRRKREAEDADPPKSQVTAVAPEPEPIATLNIMLGAAWHGEARKLHSELNGAVALVRKAQQALLRAAKSQLAREQDTLRLAEELRRVSMLLRSSVPASVCPYCKVLDGALDGCAACEKTGWISAGQMVGVPEELKATGLNAVIYYQGRKFTVQEWQASRSPEPEPERPVQTDPLELLDE